MVNVENLGVLARRLNASIPQQQLLGEVEARLKRLGRTAKVHGFRPGKAPLKVLEQQYGAQVHQEVLGDALQRSFIDAAQANSLKVAGNPNFEIKSADFSAEQIEYSATFEVYPEVILGDLSAETVERVVYSLSEEDVDSTIATLRKQRTVFEAAKRAAQNEDQVIVDFSGELNGKPFEGGEAKGFSVVLGSGRMLPDFEKAIIGMQAGETKIYDMNFPADYHGKEVAGKKVTFTVTLHSVEAPRLPEVDADFAKSLGIKDGDVSKLKEEIRGNLARETQRRLKLRNKDQAMNALLKVSQLDVPKALLDLETRNIIKQTMREMEERGTPIPQGMTLPPELFTERAQRRVKLGLILAELVKQQNLKANPEQVKSLVQDYAQSFDHPEDVVRWHYAEPSRLQPVENLVLEDNAVAWVMQTAKVTDRTIKLAELMENEA